MNGLIFGRCRRCAGMTALFAVLAVLLSIDVARAFDQRDWLPAVIGVALVIADTWVANLYWTRCGLLDMPGGAS